MAFGAVLEAEYEDGFVLTEDEADQSPYDEGRNIFHAILNARPEGEHGRMVRWTMHLHGQTFSIDWKDLWQFDNPRPIYFRKMSRDFDQGSGKWTGPAQCHLHAFGYQYLDEDGKNVQEVQEVGMG